MTSAAATFPGVPAFDRRRVCPADDRRAVHRGAGIGFGTLTAAGGTAGAVTLTGVTLAAGWMIAAALSGAPHLPGLANTTDRLTLSRFDGGFAGTMIAGLAPASTHSADLFPFSPSPEAEHDKGSRLDAVRRVRFPRERFALTPTDEGEREAAAIESHGVENTTGALLQGAATFPSGYVAATFDLFDPEPTLATALPRTSVSAPQAQPAHVAGRTNDAASSARQQPGQANVTAPLVLADADATAALPPSSDVAPAPHSALTGFLRNLFGRKEASANPDVTPALGAHTAIYDIEARTVYLPYGEKLEAHSGLGAMMDDPHYANKKDRGPTPPNVYDLALREGLFHGVQAIRLKPVSDDKMFGRDGILAHPYMLGPSGQSFGCVSFKDYRRFLKAFESGEVDRLVVVPHRGDYQRYAVNN